MKRHLLSAVLMLAVAPAPAAFAQAAPAPVSAQVQPQAHPRLLPLEGVQNARDIGGYRTADGRTVKWDVIYRTAELSHLTAHDKALLEARGLRSIHDLRTTEERQAQPTVWTDANAPTITAFAYSLDTSGFAALFQGGMPTADRRRVVFAASYPELLKSRRPQQKALLEGLLRGEGVVL